MATIMTASNKTRYINHHSYNAQASRVKYINAATADTFGFDCVNLIKGILWGWNGDKNKNYGGAKYKVNGVPDTSADGMIRLCNNVSTDFSNIQPGEAVWTNGHIGVYIGDGLAVECTPAWKNCVQITACNNPKSGYNTRKWKKHGKLPYIQYDNDAGNVTKPDTDKPKIDSAKEFDKSISGKYMVNTRAGLNIRTGANVKKQSLAVLAYGTVVRNYGYYTTASNGVKWYYVATNTGMTGFCSSTYLKKV